MRHAPRGQSAAVVALAAALAGLAVPAVAAGPDTGYTTNCPKSEPIVAAADWHSHRLARGVVLNEGAATDARGQVRLHELSVDLGNRHVSVRPLVRKVAMRRPLAVLSAHRHRLVAAANTGYFDFGTGTPLGPLVDRGRPLVASRSPQQVVGIGTTGLAQAGTVAVGGSVSAGGSSQPVAGVNLPWPSTGLTVYDPAWGTTAVQLPRDAVARLVSNGRVASAAGRITRAPSTGDLLVARGATATGWVTGLHTGSAVTVALHAVTQAAHQFRDAYGVGSALFLPGGRARAGMTCRRSYPQPARTAVGFTSGGRRLIVVAVEDHPGTSLHGLDADQMARVMADVGADQAYLFDGSGSTELLARMHRRSGLSLRTYPADGRQRPMPVGLGIFSH